MYSIEIFESKCEEIESTGVPQLGSHRTVSPIADLRRLVSGDDTGIQMGRHRRVVTVTQVLDELAKLDSNVRDLYKGPIEYLLVNLSGAVPPNDFNFMLPYLGGMSKFDLNHDMDAAALWLYQSGVGSVISIEKEDANFTQGVIELFPDFRWLSCFLEDWHAPSVEHLLAYCQMVEILAGTYGVATHCWGGTGRTGCFLAAYLIYSKQVYSAQDALKMVREKYNTHSVELMIQYNALARFSDYLGNQPSMTCFDKDIDRFVADGHWHEGHGKDGMQDFDPGHVGEAAFNGRYPRCKEYIKSIAVSAGGQHLSRGPFLTEFPDSPIHE